MLTIDGTYLQDLVICQMRSNSLTAMIFLGCKEKQQGGCLSKMCRRQHEVLPCIYCLFCCWLFVLLGFFVFWFVVFIYIYIF